MNDLHIRMHRRAAALAIALVALVIAGGLAIGMTQLVVARHRVQTAHQRHVQVVELSRAGIDRAVGQLTRSPDYEGETWTIGADQLSDSGDQAYVEIQVAPVEGGGAQQTITARAIWGEAGGRVQHTRELIVYRNQLFRE